MSKLVIDQGLTTDEDVGDSNNLVGETIFSNTFKHRKNDHIIIMILDKRNLKFFFYSNFKFKTKLQNTRYKIKKIKERKITIETLENTLGRKIIDKLTEEFYGFRSRSRSWRRVLMNIEEEQEEVFSYNLYRLYCKGWL